MAFEELSAFSGQGVRKVEFDVPKVGIECLPQLLDLRDFGPAKETFTMLKPICGLKDDPRAWRTKLHQVFVQWLSCRQLRTEPEFDCVHQQDGVKEVSSLTRAKGHNEEQQGTGNTRTTVPQVFNNDNLQYLSSVHVDDVNGSCYKGGSRFVIEVSEH